jgi:hypothetical protein
MASKIGSVAFAVLISVSVASAHIYVGTPDGGEEFEVGSTVSVVWTVQQAHEMLNWDVEYSTAGILGPFVPVATDLPEGDSSIGSVHTYDWTVPDTVSASVRIKATQDLPGEGDYTDISNQDFAIIPLQSVSRLRVLGLTRPLPDLGDVFIEPPCTRISELRICAEAPGAARDYNDPVLPITVLGNGDLVLIEFDSLLEIPDTADHIVISKGPSGTLIVDFLP